MAVRTIACTACGETVPYGRLSCPACGELLASVTGAPRPLTSLAPAPVAPAPVADPVVEPVSTPPPGAYVPPPPIREVPTATAPAPAVPRQPAGLPAPARAWGADALAPPDASADTGDDPVGLLDPARRNEAVDWVGVAGGTVAAVGFLLPWSGSVIGAAGIEYFDRWGFAGPGHPLVVLAVLAVVALAAIQNPVPAWVRLGIPGLSLGVLVVGLVWPYLFGPLGADAGALLSVIGAFILGAAAVASLASDRHVAATPPV